MGIVGFTLLRTLDGMIAMSVEPGDKVIDSRDVIARFKELDDERDPLVSELQEAEDSGDDKREAEASEALEQWDDDNGEEYNTLKELIKDCEGYGDWECGTALIHRSHWVDYCRELTEDIDGIPKDLPSYIVIDWEATADNIEADYSVVDFGDEDYLIRA